MAGPCPEPCNSYAGRQAQARDWGEYEWFCWCLRTISSRLLVNPERDGEMSSPKTVTTCYASPPTRHGSDPGVWGREKEKAQPPTGAGPKTQPQGTGGQGSDGQGPGSSDGKGGQAAGTVITRKAVRSDWRLGAVSWAQSY